MVVSTVIMLISTQIYTISRDGAVFIWREKPTNGEDEPMGDGEVPNLSLNNPAKEDYIINTRWGVSERHYFNLPNTKVVCCAYHERTCMLVVGFSSGVFGLWEMPSFTNIHTLSISQEKISSLTISPSGEWRAL